MRPMRRAERIVHVHVGQRRERGGERRVVFLFLGMKTQILEEHDAASAAMALVHGGAGFVADAVVRECDRPVQQIREPIRDRPEATSAGSACPSVGRDGSRGRRSHRCSSAYVIVGSDARMRVSSPISPSFERDVEVDANEDALALVEIESQSIGELSSLRLKPSRYRPFVTSMRSRSTQRFE